MHKLKTETWHYLYTNGKYFFISDTEPIKESEKATKWFHPGWKFFGIYIGKNKYRCIHPFWIGNPKCLMKINV